MNDVNHLFYLEPAKDHSQQHELIIISLTFPKHLQLQF